ncbi:uncharacterized protein B0P05DRAFT_592768 [Gilbertella persicaria]|uniref:uncharacterized protein n=1 Tax=Gilbertella persicaria TaxID=101096 RepID=UPI002220E1F6|nr:uncharacterized protein B0P05DRAFT_592768 [Gilbertella persicaria]KAI8047172.1 hypothetical protein B0P05DRAFT_592768 [Gilbertella persicaria]
MRIAKGHTSSSPWYDPVVSRQEWRQVMTNIGRSAIIPSVPPVAVENELSFPTITLDQPTSTTTEPTLPLTTTPAQILDPVDPVTITSEPVSPVLPSVNLSDPIQSPIIGPSQANSDFYTKVQETVEPTAPIRTFSDTSSDADYNIDVDTEEVEPKEIDLEDVDKTPSTVISTPMTVCPPPITPLDTVTISPESLVTQPIHRF